MEPCPKLPIPLKRFIQRLWIDKRFRDLGHVGTKSSSSSFRRIFFQKSRYAAPQPKLYIGKVQAKKKKRLVRTLYLLKITLWLILLRFFFPDFQKLILRPQPPNIQKYARIVAVALDDKDFRTTNCNDSRKTLLLRILSMMGCGDVSALYFSNSFPPSLGPTRSKRLTSSSLALSGQ